MSQPPAFASFDEAYQGIPPWEIGRPQPAFAGLAARGALQGSILDAGCGTGELSLMLAAQGHDVTGVDSSVVAIEIARRKAAERGVEVRFLVHDALDLGALEATVDTVCDSALFHVFGNSERRRYVQSLAAVLISGGTYHMICFSELQPGDWGPRRVSEPEIRESFTDGWRIDSLERTTLEINGADEGVRAWLASITRL